MTDNDIQLPNIEHMGRSSALNIIDIYIEEAGPTVAASESGEKFISGLMKVFGEAHLSSLEINAYLTKIANHNSMPYHVVDAAIRFQDELIDSTPELRKERDAIQAEYSHLIHPKP
jgi:succinyl-CoA synthetase beta subunit